VKRCESNRSDRKSISADTERYANMAGISISAISVFTGMGSGNLRYSHMSVRNVLSVNHSLKVVWATKARLIIISTVAAKSLIVSGIVY